MTMNGSECGKAKAVILDWSSNGVAFDDRAYG